MILTDQLPQTPSLEMSGALILLLSYTPSWRAVTNSFMCLLFSAYTFVVTAVPASYSQTVLFQQCSQCTYNLTLMRIPATTVEVEKQ
jgi:hypothetical protein